MADPSKDFRYRIGDKVIEGYQITEASRYQDKLWPDWLNSRDFLTIDGEQWFVLNGEETPIPDLAWIVREASGQMYFVDALEFENYEKVVPEYAPPLVPAPSATIIQAPPQVDDSLLLEVKVAFEMLQTGNIIDTLDHLKTQLAARTTWCSCVPGQCQEGDVWSCRLNSPLVKMSKKKPDD